MSTIALLFVGSVLLVNGLVFLRRVDGIAAVPLNTLVGGFLILAALLSLHTAEQNDAVTPALLFATTGSVLFGITYLTVAGNSLLGGTGTALGWYCAWATAIAAVLAGVGFSAGDALSGWQWTAWAVLFLAFSLALNTGAEHLSAAAGVLAILHAVTTTSVPALMSIMGVWEKFPVTVFAVIQLVVILTYAVLALRRTPAQ